MSIFKNVQRSRTNYGILNYCRINLNEVSLSGKWYDNYRQEYMLNPTASGSYIARELNATFPFKTSRYDISSGMPGLTATAKRNKFTISQYTSSNRTYTLSGNVNYEYLYPSLKTRVHWYNLFRDVTISYVNSTNNTFKTTTEAWEKDLSIDSSNTDKFYVLDETLMVSDDTAGNWKLFPYTRTVPTPSADKIILFNKVLQTPLLLPGRDTSFRQTTAYTIPFALQYEANTYTNRYFLSTIPARRRANQVNPDGRLIYDKSNNFTEYVITTVPITSNAVKLNTFNPDTVFIPVTASHFYRVKINDTLTLQNVPKAAPLSNIVDYIRVEDYKNNISATNNYRLSATSTGVKQVSTFSNDTWGKEFATSESFAVASDPALNEIHLYTILPSSTLLKGLSVITPPERVSTVLVEGVSGYGRNLTLKSRYKRKGSVDYIANSFVTVLTGTQDAVNAIEISTISYANSSYERSFFIVDSNYAHLSVNNLYTNRIENIELVVDGSDVADKYTVVAVYRPGVTYAGKTGIVEIYGNSSNTPLKLLKILTANDSSLSGNASARFGTNMSGELGTLCVAVTSNAGSQVEIFDFDTQFTITSTYSVTALSGSKSIYDFNLNTVRRKAVNNFENINDTSFGAQLYYDDELGYDPFFETAVLYTNRLYVGNNSKLFIFEEFANDFIPLKIVNEPVNTVDAYLNYFTSVSSGYVSGSNQKYRTSLFSISSYQA